MVVSCLRVMIGAFGVLYLAGAIVLAGLVTERVGADRERMTDVRAREQRAREARARVIQLELGQAAGRGAWTR
jgi:hypothetical protein